MKYKALDTLIPKGDVLANASLSSMKERLREVAGQPGYIEGYLLLHEDGDLSTQFYECYHPDGSEMDDSKHLISDVMCHDYAVVMIDLGNKYPDIIDADVSITF